MIRSSTLLCLFVFLSSWVFAQKSHRISGTLITEDQKALALASVVLLQAEDSVLSSYALTNDDGLFELRNIEGGSYLLKISFLGYEDLFKNLSIADDVDLGKLTIQKKALALNEVEIRGQRAPIVIKGDTVEYRTEAFPTRPNAAVEELLKQLPGVEVETDGSIKAQGQTVERVLVDGKEFFGDDPQVATKNLPADAVDRVQVFDKLSEMAEFTGVDDGERSKTINLALKEDRKAGYFGKVAAGAGTEGRYAGKANVNRFSPKSQFSALGMANNINEQGFSMDDYIRFSGGLDNLMSGGSVNFGGAPMGGAGSAGLTETWAGGANLNFDPFKNTEFSGSYFYNRADNLLEQSSLRETVTDQENISTRTASNSTDRTSGHRLNYSLKQELDSSQNLKVRGNLFVSDGINSSSSKLANLNAANILESQTNSTNGGDSKQFQSSTTLLYRKRFRKPGRSASAEGTFTLRENESQSRIDNRNVFWDPFTPNQWFGDTIRQLQDQTNDRQEIQLRTSYTEPLGKELFLQGAYTFQNRLTVLDKSFFDIEALSNQETFNPLLSAAYENQYRFHRPGLSVRMPRKAFNVVVGMNAQQSELEGDLISLDTAINRDFFNWLPYFSFQRKFSSAKRLRFDYQTRVQEPQINQLQPVLDNSNPLNLYIGNPDLRAEYAHNISLNYSSYSQFSFTSFFGGIQGTYTRDNIVNAVTIDSSLVQVSRPINVDRDIQVQTFFSLSAPIKPLHIKVRLDGNSSYNQGIVFVNTAQNQIDRLVNTAGIRLENRKKKLIDLRAGTRWTLNQTAYSDARELNQSFVQSSWYGEVILKPTERLSMQSEFSYTRFAGEAFAQTQSIPLWQAEVSYLLLKSKRLEGRLTAFDLLNRNTGFSRNSQLNFIEETRSNALGRYFLFSLVYNLSRVQN